MRAVDQFSRPHLTLLTCYNKPKYTMRTMNKPKCKKKGNTAGKVKSKY